MNLALKTILGGSRKITAHPISLTELILSKDLQKIYEILENRIFYIYFFIPRHKLKLRGSTIKWSKSVQLGLFYCTQTDTQTDKNRISMWMREYVRKEKWFCYEYFTLFSV